MEKDSGFVDALFTAKPSVGMVPGTTESQPESDKKEEPAPSQEEPKVEPKVEEPKAEPEDSAQKKEVPFHKHPRWIRQQKEMAELKAALEAERQAKAQAQPVATPQPTQSVPPELSKLFGDDVEAYKQWQTMLESVSERKAKELIEKMAEEAEKEEQQQQDFQSKAVQWAEDQFLELSEATGVDLSEKSSTQRNQILDIIDKYGLYDVNGLPKIKEANDLRAALYPEQADTTITEKKKVLSRTNTKTNSQAKESDFYTPKKIQEIKKRGGVHFFMNS